MNIEKLDFYESIGEILKRFGNGGVLCTVKDNEDKDNVLTLGWGQIGPFYNKNPVAVIAVTPLRYSWEFLEQTPEFVLSIPNDSLKKETLYCGQVSGRDADKFKECGFTKIKSQNVKPVSIKECKINIECRIYTKICPPHMLLSENHRKKPLNEQHTIYFAEVLGLYRY